MYKLFSRMLLLQKVSLLSCRLDRFVYRLMFFIVGFERECNKVRQGIVLVFFGKEYSAFDVHSLVFLCVELSRLYNVVNVF